jgi:hypothetical protein
MLYRQGDVLIERVEAMPDSGTAVEPKHGLVILAEGEATGHHHSIAATDVESVIEGDGAMFLKLIRDSVVSHQEHGAISLKAGNYRVTRQREYTPEEVRNVAD